MPPGHEQASSRPGGRATHLGVLSGAPLHGARAARMGMEGMGPRAPGVRGTQRELGQRAEGGTSRPSMGNFFGVLVGFQKVPGLSLSPLVTRQVVAPHSSGVWSVPGTGEKPTRCVSVMRTAREGRQRGKAQAGVCFPAPPGLCATAATSTLALCPERAPFHTASQRAVLHTWGPWEGGGSGDQAGPGPSWSPAAVPGKARAPCPSSLGAETSRENSAVSCLILLLCSPRERRVWT